MLQEIYEAYSLVCLKCKDVMGSISGKMRRFLKKSVAAMPP